MWSFASGHLHGAYAGDEEPRSLEEAVDTTLAVMGTILGASHKLLKYRRLLERSPVTYIHDLIMAVRSATGFADGLFVDMPHLDTSTCGTDTHTRRMNSSDQSNAPPADCLATRILALREQGS